MGSVTAECMPAGLLGVKTNETLGGAKPSTQALDGVMAREKLVLLPHEDIKRLGSESLGRLNI